MATPTESSPTTDHLPPPPRRIRRSSSGSLAGVARGAADYFGIPVRFVRIGFLVGLFFGGAGFFAYLAAWLLIPDDRDTRPDTFVVTDCTSRLIAGIVFAFFALGAVSGTATVSLGMLVPAALVGGGVYLLMQDDRKPIALARAGQNPFAGGRGTSTVSAPPPPPSPTTPHPDADDPDEVDDRDPLLIEAERLMTGEAWSDSAESMALDPDHWALTKAEAEVATITRRRRPITAVALGTALLICLLLLVTNSAVGLLGYAIVFFAVSVISFIASLFFRRPAWTLLPTALVSLVVLVFAAAVPSLDEGFGHLNFEFVTVDVPGLPVAPVAPQVDFGVGFVEEDLQNLELTEDTVWPIDLGAGVIDLKLPDNYRVNLILSGRQFLQLGDGDPIRIDDGTMAVFNANATSDHVLTIDAGDGIGVVSVNRNPNDVQYESAN